MQPSFQPRRPLFAETIAIAMGCSAEEARRLLARPRVGLSTLGLHQWVEGETVPWPLERFELGGAEAWDRFAAAGYVQPARDRTFACEACNALGNCSYEINECGSLGWETCGACKGTRVQKAPWDVLTAIAIASDFARIVAFEEDARGRTACEVTWRMGFHPPPENADDAARGPTYTIEEREAARLWLRCPRL